MVETAFQRYLDLITGQLTRLGESQKARLQAAARLIADSLAEGGVLHVFGTAHSQLLAQEIFYRAGCLVPTNALIEPYFGLRKGDENTYWFERQEPLGKVIFEAYDLRPGEVIVIISTSGRNEVPVEVALRAKERGLKVVALLSEAYCARMEPRHSSGKKLPEIADVVLDNGAPVGDAALKIEGTSHKVGPISGVLGAAVLQGLVAQVVELLVERGVEPPVWVSINVPGGPESNARHVNRYGGRIKHL